MIAIEKEENSKIMDTYTMNYYATVNNPCFQRILNDNGKCLWYSVDGSK